MGALKPRSEDEDATIVLGEPARPAVVDDDATLVFGAQAATAPAPDDYAPAPHAAPVSPAPSASRPLRITSIEDVAAPPVQAERPLPAAWAEDGSVIRRLADLKRIQARQTASGGGVLGPVVQRLVDSGAMPEQEAVAIALRAREQGATFFQVLAAEGDAAANVDLYAALAQQEGLRFIAARDELASSIEETEWLDAKCAEQRGALLLKSTVGSAIAPCAMLDPFDLVLRDWLRGQAGKPVEPVVVTPSAFYEVLTGLRTRVEAPRRGDENFVPIDVSWQQENMVLDQPLTADVPLIVDYILQRCQNQKASDIHIEPTEEGLLIRARIDGLMHEESRMPLELHAAVVSRIKVLAQMDVAERRRPQDGRISVMIRKSPLDVRVSTLPTVLGEKVVMRLLDESALRPSPEQLGLRDANLRLILDKINAPHGLILIGGPTGSGKTTTLYSFLSAVDRLQRNVVTIEDPVEYRLSGVHQMQVNDKIGLTFASGLRTVLRQDPDVIMVGECRDRETGHMAVQAALTGHVVFSTIHANDCLSVITRLLDMKIDPYLVAASLSLTLSQRLVRVCCSQCSTLVEGREVMRRLRNEGVSQEKLARMGVEIDDNMPVVQPSGCPHCRHSGYSGRQPVFEMMAVSTEMRKLIVSEHFDSDELRRLARETGFVTMIENGLSLVEEGRTTFSELIRVFGDA
jgi:type IV pilus assembly protein PilB